MGRVRIPSSRALDIAASVAASSSRSGSTSNRQSTNNNDKKELGSKKRGRPFSKPQAIVKRTQDEQVNDEDDGEDNNDNNMMGLGDEDEEEEEEEEREPDSTLYCVCLGIDTGEQPMIQCENCSNWFHFTCIGLNEKLAAEIEAYCCDTCEEMGMGHTRRSTGKKPAKLKPKQKPKATASVPLIPIQSFASDSDSIQEEEEELEQDDEDSFLGSDSEEEPDLNTMQQDEDVNDDEEYGMESELSNAKKRGKRPEIESNEVGGEQKRRRRRKVEIDSEEEDDDEEYAEHGELGEGNRRSRGNGSRSRRKRQSSVINSPPPSSNKSKVKKPSNSVTTSSTTITSVPATDKTRSHCIKTLTTLFISIFSASNTDTIAVEVKSSSFATLVEEKLFEALGEVDPTTSIRAPRTKYTTKFRSLVFNLKSNASFRSRISNSEFTASQIANMTNEDLLTPELKAMAESVRAASLKHSVKEVIAAPTAKLTHKGEVEIENHAARAAAEEERVFAEKDLVEKEKRIIARERSTSVSGVTGSPSIAPSPIIPDSYAFDSPIVDRSNSPGIVIQSSPVVSKARPSFSNPADLSDLADDIDMSFESFTSTTPCKTSIPLPHIFEDVNQDESMLPPPLPSSTISTIPARSRNSFDLGSIWASTSKGDTTSANESNDEVIIVDDDEIEFDPFAIASKAGNDDDDFETLLQKDDNIPPPSKFVAKHTKLKSALSSNPVLNPKSTSPPLPPAPPITANSNPVLPLSELDPVWAGDLIVPDEGGFPAFGVQVGGRYFGSTYQIWNQILPKGLSMSGRISTKVGNKYLVECAFASTRELIVLALLPDLTGPSEWFPSKPEAERCLAKHTHVVGFYVKKDRIGVVSPPENLKKVVKDIYIIPLKKEDPLPEYVQLLDEHNVPETGDRDRDILLAVIVIQKGSLTPVPRPLPPSAVKSIPISESLPISIPESTKTKLPPSLPPKPFNQIQSPIIPVPLPRAIQSNPYSQSPPIQSRPLPPPPPVPTFDPTSLQSILQSNPDALASLLANPSLIQSVMNPSSSRPIPNQELSPGRLDEVLAGLSSASLPPANPSSYRNPRADYNSNDRRDREDSYRNEGDSYRGGRDRNDDSYYRGAVGGGRNDRYENSRSPPIPSRERERERDNYRSSSVNQSPPIRSQASPPPVTRPAAFVHPSRMGLVGSVEDNSNNNSSRGGGNEDSRNNGRGNGRGGRGASYESLSGSGWGGRGGRGN